MCHRSVAIKIQQDNAKPQLIRNDDPQLQAAVAATGMNITLINHTYNWQVCCTNDDNQLC
jgi:hypothetical protein